MNKSISISFVLIVYSSILFAQNDINSYKYILVPKQFEFQKEQDQYQLNSLTKFLFNKAGYTVLFTDEQYPTDLANNSCLALKVKVNSNPSVFKTKMRIDLYNCYNSVIYSTKEGVSREKEYKKAYQEAIRLAFAEFEEFEYLYNDTTATDNSKQDKNTIEVVTVPLEAIIRKTEQVEELEEAETAPKIIEIEPVEETNLALVKVTENVKTTPLKIAEKSDTKTIEGKFIFEKWGVSTISKRDDNFSVVGGDENFEFATIYKTSKPSIFIIKWVAYKQPQLLEIDSDGNLNVDTEKGIKTYKKVH